jgi:hypothetical protein
MKAKTRLDSTFVRCTLHAALYTRLYGKLRLGTPDVLRIL